MVTTRWRAARGTAPLPDLGARLLFVAERLPPSVGGQQAYNASMLEQFRAHLPTWVLAPACYLPLNLQRCWYSFSWVLQGWWLIRRHGITHVHLSSARLASVGWALRRLTHVQLSASVHGLDVTLSGKGPLYRALVPRCLGACRWVIANSRATRAQALHAGLDPSRCHVVACGADPERHHRRRDRATARRDIAAAGGPELGDRTALLTVGRLIPRKGVAWCIESVLPQLPEECVYLVAGQDGPERRRLEQLVASAPRERLRLFVSPDDAWRDLLYDAADVFVMPNVVVPGHREGFGLVLLEAGLHDLPVVASAVEGIPDAVLEGITGLLVPERDGPGFAAAIRAAAAWRPQGAIRQTVAAHYSWHRAYHELAGLAWPTAWPGPASCSTELAPGDGECRQTRGSCRHAR